MKHEWRVAALEDVAKVVNGGTPKTKVSEYWGGPHLWITPAEMGGLPKPYLRESRRSLTDEGLAHSSASLIPTKSVILSTRAPIGHLVINDKPMAFNQGCRGIIPGEHLHHKFLYYWLLSNVKKLDDLGSGTTFKELAAGKLKKVLVPTPPLSQQKRIVAILDEAFAGIETAIANAERNLANAQELFESHLNAVFDARRPNWQKTTLGELYRIGSSKRVHKKDWRDRGVPFYRAREIVKLAENGVVDNELFLSEELFEEYSEKTGVPQDGDLMVTAVGTLGICYVVQPADRFYFKDASVLWFRPKAPVNAKFIQYAFRSPVVKRQTTDSQGATVGTLTISRANAISITVPTLEVQDEIARSLDEIESGILELRAVQQSKLDALRELKQSLLQKAFSGELTVDCAQREVDSATA